MGSSFSFPLDSKATHATMPLYSSEVTSYVFSRLKNLHNKKFVFVIN